MTAALTVLNSAMARLKGNTLTGTVLGVAEDREEGCQRAPPRWPAGGRARAYLGCPASVGGASSAAQSCGKGAGWCHSTGSQPARAP